MLRPEKHTLRWVQKNSFRLLENGEEFFPRLIERIDAAEEEILIETFIWFEDGIGKKIGEHLKRAAERGVEITVTADGYGSNQFSKEFLQELHSVGIDIRLFDPQPTFFRIRTNLFCRLHRKLAVVDKKFAFVGGINLGDDHLRAYGPQSKQDYAVEVQGPVVEDIHRGVIHGPADSRTPWWKRSRYWLRRFPKLTADPKTSAQALFATRDNSEHPTDIETLIRLAIRRSQDEIIMAIAYFFPGYRFVRDLLRARKRGVRIKLILQGRPDLQWAAWAASIMYDKLTAGGVEIHLFTERPLHAKVAVIDDHWSTVGSSNLDPFSLGMNYEANLFILDRDFNSTLKRSLNRLIDDSCSLYEPRSPGISRIRQQLAIAAFHLARRMPSWGKRFIRRPQKTARVGE